MMQHDLFYQMTGLSDDPIIWFILALFYFLPTIVARLRDYRFAGMVFFFNLLLAWTVLIWIVLLLVSFYGEKKEHEPI